MDHPTLLHNQIKQFGSLLLMLLQQTGRPAAGTRQSGRPATFLNLLYIFVFMANVLPILKVSGLYIYPIKSLPGISLQQARVTPKGFEHDRRWMLVDENNMFMSQREIPELTQLAVVIEESGLRITHKLSGDSILVPFNYPATNPTAQVTIWDDVCTAQFISDEVDEWFSKAIGIKCRLVYMPDDSMRIVDQLYAIEESITSFSDGYPFLLIGQASLNELNSRLAEPLPMDRFRPNIVFTDGEPFEEDLMGHFTIGDISFYGVKLCARCVMTTIDQEKGCKGKEPLKTLASYRLKNNKILFGQNLVHKGNGVVAINDQLTVTSKNVDERFIVEPVVKKRPVDIDKKLV
ncbi:hypothetical protein JN11_03255 [Mucilaginibacter frigoritolerans]|uniref:MOSC domain-containing protein n=2 Tax=Mucilaginibacter frigoritolerans TaxID=652788 RepID=A0A562TYL6_9SPHI|nr:hypothetical protein JN11_03255 [Mucilaginibacter frigoritolerans]